MTTATTTTEPVTIPLERLIANPDYQPRAAGLSESHLRLLMETGAETFPPLLVTPNADGTFTVLDGFHRIAAARRLDVAALPCVVSPEAGFGDAVAANLRHGLPLAMADRKDSARWWMEQEPGLSDRAIAVRVGLSPTTVGRVRQSKVSTVDTSRDQKETGPMPRWLTATAKLERPPTVKAISRDLVGYRDEDRPEVAQLYTAVGKALITGAAPYLSGTSR